MSVKINGNEEIARVVLEGLSRNGGYCPCRREKTEETKCPCREFREQIADPRFEGYCRCRLYYKTPDGKPENGEERERRTAPPGIPGISFLRLY